MDDDMTWNDRLNNIPAVTAVQVVGRLHPIDRVETLAPEFGGNDEIFTGGGPDLVLGGSGSDQIETFGVEAAGQADFDLVAGDNARVTMMLSEARHL